jgi:hypothetical protein
MKKLLTFLFFLIFSVTYSQSGVGYLNYTVYNIISNGAGQYANNATDFVNMFDVTKGAKVYASGTSTAAKTLYFANGWQPSGVPNGGAYTGIKVTGWFVAKETGTYTFGIDGDDGVDFSLNGSVVTSFYGPHGFGGYRYGTINLVAGQSYTFMARYQNWGGGWGMYVAWKRPSQSSYTTQADEVYSTPPASPTKKGFLDFNTNTNLDATKFSVGSNGLSSTGTADITTLLDSTKVSNGNKGVIVAGGAEWSYVNTTNSTNTLYIDLRKFGNTDPSTVTQIKILDVYEGSVTYVGNDIYWAHYTIPTALPKLTDGTSTNTQYIRNAGYDNYAFTCDISFASVMQYKTQSVSISTTNNLTTLYNSIVTVSDVWLAFKEVSNVGLFGNQSGNEFTYGIQYQNADVNDDGVLDERDAFLLLQHLTGVKSLVDTFKLSKTLRIIPQSTYDMIGKSNWNTFTNKLDSTYTFEINTGKSTDTLNLAMAWKGDVNLSHSTTPTSNGYTTMSLRSMSVSNEIQSMITSELIGDSVVVTITLNPLSQQVVGTQFQINYDNSLLKFSTVKFTTIGNPTNFGVDKGSYINVGSLNSDGNTFLDNSTTYKITFKTLTKLNNIFGLISVGTTDAVNQGGTQLKIKLI